MKAKKGIDCTAAEAQEQQDKVNDITEKMMMLHNQVFLFLQWQFETHFFENGISQHLMTHFFKSLIQI